MGNRGDYENHQIGGRTRVGLAAKHSDVKVVLMGPDCSGKSTLAAALSKHYDIPILANRKIRNDMEAVRAVMNFALDRLPQEGFILDQWQFPVDIVYEKALGKDKSPMKLLVPILEPFLCEQRVLFIHLDANPWVIKERFAHRGDELWSVDQIIAVAEEYRRFVRHGTDIHRSTIDTSYSDPLGVFQAAVQIIDTYYKHGSEEE